MFKAHSPRVPQYHLFEAEGEPHLLVVNGSRLYAVEPESYAALWRAAEDGDENLAGDLLTRFGLNAEPFVDDEPLRDPPARSLSLAVAQKCNLGCTYCYAQQGEFGGTPKLMSLEVALASVEFLFKDAREGERLNLSFLGGEPLVNRPVLRAAAEHAAHLARETGARIGFSVTTNGTLLNAEDGEFFERHGFAVTVSLDGVGDVHNRLRAYRDGRGTYDRILSNVAPLLQTQRRMQLSARVTVTPGNLRLLETLDEFVRLGFHSVGFSPMLRSPKGSEEMAAAELEIMLQQMIDCGGRFEESILAGRRYPFANMVNSMREIHQGTHRPYPCGAGAGYFGVSSEGELSACHRFVGDEAGRMGSLFTGIDRQRQRAWLEQRHVHRQEPCRSCWARYLCGGGCHHEVISRGRPACDYIRGWLHYCLQAYARLSRSRPDYFGLAPSDAQPEAQRA